LEKIMFEVVEKPIWVRLLFLKQKYSALPKAVVGNDNIFPL